jgi:hypothetical protein
MKPHYANEFVKRLIITNLTFIFLLVLLAAAQAKPLKQQGPPFSFPGGKRGQEAITALQGRLPAVASRYGKSVEKLKKTFLQDRDLWLDPAEKLLYLCSFDISETDVMPEPAPAAIPTVPLPLDQTFRLHSLPGASRVIYLDFDGHVTSGTVWNTNFNGGADIVSLPYDFNGNTASFSDAELSRIQNIWARVAEDFAIYEIDVTTEDPGIEALRRSGSGDQDYGVRVVISPSSSWYGSAGGVAYVGSFSWNSDTPTFVFSDKLGSGTDAASHETGHTLGLSHDGVTGGTAYYQGHGSWAPIMGVGYYKPITQWSKGEYANANNTQDDLAVMLNNGASYRQDDHGNWIDSATMLSGDTFEAAGIIEKTGDTDVFAFQTEAGNISISIDPANLDPDLDILVQILDDGGNIINQDDPYYILPASLNLNLPAGTYYILIDGVGTGDPNTGYSDYASLGQYFISGSLPSTQFPPAMPTGLSAGAASSSQINLNWTDNSTNENGFSVERSANGGSSWAEVGFTSANIKTYADSGLNPNTTYHYRVSAYNVIGGSDYTNTASATTFDLPPSAPVSLSAAPAAAGQIILHWTDTSSNETGFAIERSPNGANSWEEIITVADNVTTYADSGLASGTTFYYRVSAYNLNGNSGFSNTASATTAEVAPEGPAALNAVAASATEIQLNWQDNSTNETGFKIERSANGIDQWLQIATVGPNITGYTDNTLSTGTTYYYRVFSFNTAGSSSYSNTAGATTDEPPQFIEQTVAQEAAIAGTVSNTFVDTQANDSAVETIREETSGGRQSNRYSYLEHKWMVNVQSGSAVTLFANVWASVSAAGDTFVFSYSTDDETYVNMFTVAADSDDDSYHAFPLPANLSGTIYIRVRDSLRTPGYYDTETLYIDHLFVRTDNDGDLPPQAPSDLTATGIAFDAIALSWTDQADNELGFLIQRSPDGTKGWEQIGSAGPDTTTYTDTGLPMGATFYYRVQAFNPAGDSGFTAIASGSTSQTDSLHVAALESNVEENRRGLDAYVIITVHDQNGSPVAGAEVKGLWDTGDSGSGITGETGQCTVNISIRLRRRVSVNSTSFMVTELVKEGYIYDPASNLENSIVISIR